MARYVHFDVRASRRSRKQIQSFSSELIRFSARSPQPIRLREHINHFSETRIEWHFSANRTIPSSQPLTVPRVYGISSSQP